MRRRELRIFTLRKPPQRVRLLNALLLRYPDVTIVCHYDMHRMSGAAAIGAMCSHPHVHLPHQFRPGYYAQEHAAA
jgi:hypothetical protein